MHGISAISGVVKGVTKIVGSRASAKGEQVFGSVFKGVKSASQVSETTHVVFDNKFFKTVQEDVHNAMNSQFSLESVSDEIMDYIRTPKSLKTSKAPKSDITIKGLFQKIHQGLIKPDLLRIDRATVNRLNGLSEEEFLSESINFIFSNYVKGGQKIPKELMPTVLRYNMNGIDMAYDSMQNLFLINSELKVKNRASIFGLIKHELTHMWQALDIFRTKSLGEKFSRIASQKVAKLNCEQIKVLAVLPQEKFAKLTSHPNFAIIQRYRQLLDSPETADQYINAIYENTVNALYSANEQKRMFIVKSLGTLAEDSKRGQRAKLFFQYFKRGASEDMTKNPEKFQKYLDELAEKEAYGQTIIGAAEYLFPEINRMFV